MFNYRHNRHLFDMVVCCHVYLGNLTEYARDEHSRLYVVNTQWDVGVVVFQSTDDGRAHVNNESWNTAAMETRQRVQICGSFVHNKILQCLQYYHATRITFCLWPGPLVGMLLWCPPMSSSNCQVSITNLQYQLHASFIVLLQNFGQQLIPFYSQVATQTGLPIHPYHNVITTSEAAEYNMYSTSPSRLLSYCYKHCT